VQDFQFGQTPALDSHVGGHNAEALCLHFAGMVGIVALSLRSNAWISLTVWRFWKQQAAAMQIRANEQERTADGIERCQQLATAEAIHMNASVIAPSVLV
jgi:hypothetical protein